MVQLLNTRIGMKIVVVVAGGGGPHLFSGRSVRPAFLKCGDCELIIASERGSCEQKNPNLGSCELKISRAKILDKIGVVEAKISHFFLSQKRVL